HWNLYRFHGSEEEFNSAVEAVKESIHIRPGHAEARLLYATMLFQSEQYDEVLSEVQFVLDEEIMQHDALCLRGMVHMQRKQWEAAEATFQKVLNEDPLFPLAVQKMAEVKILKLRNRAP
ncbi:MAG: tetratricopeptide repeat protein, partial [Pirellulaceae bacterium]